MFADVPKSIKHSSHDFFACFQLKPFSRQALILMENVALRSGICECRSFKISAELCFSGAKATSSTAPMRLNKVAAVVRKLGNGLMKTVLDFHLLYVIRVKVKPDLRAIQHSHFKRFTAT